MLFNIPNTSTEYQTQYVYLNAKGGEQRVVAKPVEGSSNIYMFKCRVAAKDMESEISAQMFNGDDKSVIYTYSVKKYADYLIDHKNDSAAYAKAVPLVQAMLVYGKNANYYFGGETEPEEISETVIPEYNSTVEPFAENIFDGATLSLKSETTLSLYFVSKDPITLSIDGKTEGVDYELQHVGYDYVIRIRNIAVYDLDKPITVKVNGEDAVTYSPLTYCYKAQQTSTNSKLVNTVKALYNYHREATDYFEPQAGGGE